MAPKMHFLTATRAFADATRVRILAGLRDGELCVCDLVEVLGVRQSTLSTHLQVLRAAGLVRSRRDGKWSHYAIDPQARPTVDALFATFATSLDADRRLQSDARRFRALGPPTDPARDAACCAAASPSAPCIPRRKRA